MFVPALESSPSKLRDKLVESQCLLVTSHDLTEEGLFQAALCVCSHTSEAEDARQLLIALGLHTEKEFPVPLVSEPI